MGTLFSPVSLLIFVDNKLWKTKTFNSTNYKYIYNKSIHTFSEFVEEASSSNQRRDTCLPKAKWHSDNFLTIHSTTYKMNKLRHGAIIYVVKMWYNENWASYFKKNLVCVLNI